MAGVALAAPIAAEDAATQEACIADALPSLRPIDWIPDCTESPKACSDSCGPKSPGDCLAAAYAYERQSDRANATRLYRRACLLGLANACTNYAAGIWVDEESTDAALTCAHEILRRSCVSKNHFACGMMGRLAFERAQSPADFAAGRKELEAACASVGGFSCRVLAKQLETGKLGRYEPEEIADLLEQACEGDDTDACGQPKTASKTFE
jgi:TPR repeat protein